MALSLYPKLDNKLTAAILWSQVFSAVHWDFDNLSALSRPFLTRYTGPAPPASVADQLQAILGAMCANKLGQIIFCTRLGDILLGFSGIDAVPMRPEFLNTFFMTSSSHEMAQIVQNTYTDRQMHYYSDKPIVDSRAYNLSEITNTGISFYVGSTDTLAGRADNEATVPRLKVPTRTHIIDGAFNHNAFFFHRNCSRAAIIPSLREIQEFSIPASASTRLTSPEANLHLNKS